MIQENIHVAVLWGELPTYLTACLESLQSRYSVKLVTIRISINHQATSGFHPYDENVFTGLQKILSWEELGAARIPRLKNLQALLDDFRPQVALVGNWAHSPYIPLLSRLRRRNTVVIGCMDNQWRGTAKQRIMILLQGWLRNHFDYLWVPGDRQAQYARKIGFGNDRILYGLYVCDSKLFSRNLKNRSYEQKIGVNRRFLYVGRFVNQKGITDLVAAYRTYRARVIDPWDLHCIGGGPLFHLLQNEPGIIVENFRQPEDLVHAFEEADVFVLPSRYEPWGVVIHEAATAGMPIICSDECGAAVELLQDGYNGFLFDSGNIAELTRLLELCSSRNMDLACMGSRSAKIAERFTSDRWADYLVKTLEIKSGIHIRPVIS